MPETRNVTKCNNCRTRMGPDDGQLRDDGPWCYRCLALREPEEYDKIVEERVTGVDVERVRDTFDPQADQTWYADPYATIESIRSGGAVIGSASCDMTELVYLADKWEWAFRFEAGGVYYVEPV